MSTKFSKMSAASVTVAAILCAGLAGCTRTETTNTVVENSVSYETGPDEGGPGPGGDQSDGGGWSVTSERDAITDEQVNKAVASLSSSDFRIDLSVACGSRHLATYEFAAFDRNGDPQPLRWREKGVAIVDAVVPYDLRLDGGEAQSRLGYGRRFNNAFSIGANSFAGDYATAMASAHSVVMRFELLSGDATIEWDQTDPEVRRVLAPCMKPKAVPLAQPDTQTQTEPPADDSDAPPTLNE